MGWVGYLLGSCVALTFVANLFLPGVKERDSKIKNLDNTDQTEGAI